MDSNHIKVDKNQQIFNFEKYCYHSVLCMFLTMALCPVSPAFAMAPHKLSQTLFILSLG